MHPMNGKMPRKRRRSRGLFLVFLSFGLLLALVGCIAKDAPPAAPPPPATPLPVDVPPAGPRPSRPQALHEKYRNLFYEADFYDQGQAIYTNRLPIERCTREGNYLVVRKMTDPSPAVRPVLGLRVTTYAWQHTEPLDGRIIYASVDGQTIPAEIETLPDQTKGIAIYTWRLKPEWRSVRVDITKPVRFQLALMEGDIDWSAYPALLADERDGSADQRPCFP